MATDTKRIPATSKSETTREASDFTSRAEASARSRLRRHKERSVPTEADRILEAGRTAHVAYVIDGLPYVIPFLYDYADGAVYLHGAPGSRTLKSVRAGMSVAIEVTLLDGLIASRDAESHSANYRSVVVYGIAQRITRKDEKHAILERMTQRYFPGRTVDKDYAAATEKQIVALEVLRVPVEEFSAKMREGGPRGPRDSDESETQHTAFVLHIGGHEI